MIGLGVLGNQPANPYQPALTDGIHLRWGFLRELGFPWHGFYLYRRPALPGRPLCLSSVSGGLKKGVWPDTKYYSAIGLVSSSEKLVLTDDFTPANQVEFALSGRNFLRFDLPAGELARRIDLRIGSPPQRCIDFQKLIPPPDPPQTEVIRSNPLILQQVSFSVTGIDGKPAANTRFKSINLTNAMPIMGLNCDHGVTIKLPSPNNSVELLFTNNVTGAAIGAVAEAFDSKNKMVATAQMVSGPNQPKTVTLTAQNITKIEIRTARSTHFLHRVCGDKLSVGGEALARGTAFSGTTPVSTFTIDSQAGQIASVSIEGDALSAVEIAPCAGSLVDLCYVPVAQDATQGWEKLPKIRLSKNIELGFTYPIGLPVLQSDYPCSVTNPQSLLTERVRYALPAEWDGTTFTQLHDQLVELVRGGPSAAPMVDRIFAAPPAVSNPPDLNPPKLSTFYILDMILLGALHPALAQLVGLSWVDQTAAPNVAYDYLIVADHTGVGERNADKVLEVIRTSGFTKLDGYIVFNKHLAAHPPLTAPGGLLAYELPGGTFPDAQGQLPQASNNAGLCWDLNWDNSDELLPESAVMYLVWRADLGNAATPAPAGSHSLVTKLPPDKPRPILVTEPRLPNSVAPPRSPDWPPFPLHFIDRNLPDGWYSYQVSGIDLFGRHSLNSAPTELLVRDKIPPPIPTAVEAYALDPEDRFLQRDDAYNDWHVSLDASVLPTLVGLRVRWRWTRAHQQQAPDTKEFRLYFHPGAELPPDHDLAINWQKRYYVVGYHDNVKIDSLSGDRAYEILLPTPPASSSPSIPLNPSLAEPVVYAHIGVSAADDKPHTNDLRATGNWSNRAGNEGRVGPPAKIYRVWRTLPPPPDDVFASDRLYASPANYHDQSFFTYRWQPQTHLNLHVFRAMDDAVFKADWARRPSVPVNESQLEFFPAGWNQATRQSVAAELNLLNSFVGIEKGSEKAMTYYRQLPDAALRVLAGLPSSESAFVQLTINPLKPNDAGNLNKLGPDNPDDLILDMNQRAFIDTLDGRSTNGYFYRSALIDEAHNLGPLGLSSPPVYLPNVVPPRAPVITKVLGGDREITIKWASNREPDLAEYRVYRTDNEEATRDLRLMTLVHTEPVAPGDPSSRPTEVIWTDSPVRGLKKYYYRLCAVDNAGNRSDSSPVLVGQAFDYGPPGEPIWERSEWVKLDESGHEHPWAETETALVPCVALVLTVAQENVSVLIERHDGRWRSITQWLPAATYDEANQVWRFTHYDGTAEPLQAQQYRVTLITTAGVSLVSATERSVPMP